MGFIEFIGFIVSLFFLLILFTRPLQKERQRKKDPQRYAALQKRQEQQLRKMYETLGIEKEPVSSVEEKPIIEKEIPSKKIERSKKHAKRLVLPPTPPAPSYLSYGKIKEQKSSVARILAKHSKRKELIIIQETLNRPLGLDP